MDVSGLCGAWKAKDCLSWHERILTAHDSAGTSEFCPPTTLLARANSVCPRLSWHGRILTAHDSAGTSEF